MLPVGGSNGGHELHGLGYSPTNEVPPWRLRKEGDDEEDKEEGGDGRGDEEVAPCLEDVGDGGEKCNANREEVEGGHAGHASLRGANGLGGEHESAKADAAGAEAGEEAEEDIDPVVRGERC